MSGVFGYSREAVRVKVQKCEGLLQPEYRKFSVDPQITSFEVLQSIIAKAFDLKGEFTVSYRAIDDYGQETYLSLLSDWDLDAAFLSASEPCLGLQIEAKPFEESSEEWDGGNQVDIDVMPSIRGLEALRLPHLQMQRLQGTSNDRTASHLQSAQSQSQGGGRMQHRLPGLILNQVERTFNMVQRALNLGDESQPNPVSAIPPRQPLTDAEFRMFLDPIGQVVQDRELRRVIYYGGIEPSLRKVVWKHILNVYPDGMSGRERMDYMKKKAHEYSSLRDCWREMIHKGQVSPDLNYVTSMVRKDVLRTDRHHPFYAGSDDNQNIASLFNILTTYALNHPSVSYCQGMSDLASPLLVTMGDEAHAYICFCALMRRLRPNFMLDGEAMTLRFQHLSDGLMFYDPDFYAYLKSHQADDLLFCYRWLLLEMKREFAFDDALRMMEVMWSSLPNTGMDPSKELDLFDVQFTAPPSGQTPPPISPLLKAPRENAYTKVCALRRQGSAASLMSRNKHLSSTHRQNQSLDETCMSKVARERKVKPYSSLDDTALGYSTSPSKSTSDATRGKENCLEGNQAPKTPRSPCSPRSSSSEKESLSRTTSGIRKHFKEKFQAGRCKNLFLSLEKLDRHHDSISEETNDTKSESARVVKNLNEFLNFSNLNKGTLMSPKKGQRDEVSQEDATCTVKSYDCSPEQTVERPKSNNSLKHEDFRKSSSSTNERGVSGDSSPDDTEYYPMTTSMTRELRLELDSLDRQVFGSNRTRQSVMSDDTEDTESACSESMPQETESDTTCNHHGDDYLRAQANCGNDDVFLWENPLKASPQTPDEQAELEHDSKSGDLCTKTYSSKHNTVTTCHKNGDRNGESSKNSTSAFSGASAKLPAAPKRQASCSGSDPVVMVTSNTSCEEAIDLSNVRPLPSGVQMSRLPPPSEFGGGNPFLMFLCLTVLCQHRDFIIQNNMDYNEVAMHFDKMVRKHDVTRVLNQARRTYAAYLKQYHNNNKSGAVGSSGHSASSNGLTV